MKRILALLKILVKFTCWAVVSWREVDQYNSDDYSAMIAVFTAFGTASLIIPTITFFARPEYFRVVAVGCLCIYFFIGVLFCWFLKSQYNYSFLKNK